MKKQYITLFAFAIAILGIISQLAAFIPNPFEDPLDFVKLRNFFSLIWLDCFQMFYYRIDTQNLNILSLLGSIALLIGVILYTTSNGQKVALLRYMLAIMFINCITGFVEGVFYSTSLWFRVTSAVEYIAVLIAAYFSLKEISNTFKYVESPEPASKLNRAIHWFVDLPTMVITLSSFIPFYSFFSGIESEYWSSFAFLSIGRFAYYMLFETIFKATPAKFLTQTKVIQEDGGDPGLLEAIVRTLSRFIPFEPVSFFWSRGWHDRFSQTSVVKEVRDN